MYRYFMKNDVLFYLYSKPCIQVVFSSQVTSPIFAAQFFLNIPITSSIHASNFDDEMSHIFELYTETNYLDLLTPSSLQSQ
jgi:hypothetical protein